MHYAKLEAMSNSEKIPEENQWRTRLFEIILITVLIAALLSTAVNLILLLSNSGSTSNIVISFLFSLIFIALYFFARKGQIWPRWVFVLSTIPLLMFIEAPQETFIGSNMLAAAVPLIAASYFISSVSVLIITPMLIAMFFAQAYRAGEGYWGQYPSINSIATIISLGIVSWAGSFFTEKAIHRIHALIESKNKFIHIVSHQLRTPLASMRWQFESLLDDQENLNPEQKETIKAGHEADVIVINRLNQLLMALDIQEGKLSLDPKAIELDKILNTILEKWTDLFEAKQILLKVKSSLDLPAINGDEAKLKIVLEQLFNNAYDYSKVKGKVSVRLEKLEAMLRFTITDTGIGIPTKEQKKIFTQFFRASNAEAVVTDRSGVGLYISKYIIEQHQGKIAFKSQEGSGSSFWFELPILRDNKSKDIA